MPRLVVVSNRVPNSNGQPQTGGLAVALEPVLRRHGGLWVGWDGEPADCVGQTGVETARDGYSLATVKLSEEEYRGYYREHANRTLWPLFHDRTDLARCDPESYATYLRVNDRFAQRLQDLLRPDDRIWIHDYHLIPLGNRLRERGVRTQIGFFLHIPFPCPKVLGKLPWADEIVNGLSAYDLIGFQTEECRRNFERAKLRLGNASAVRTCETGTMQRRTTAKAFPISIDTRHFERLAASSSVAHLASAFQEFAGSEAWICSVDRLDYSKGLPEKLQAFELFLEDAPEFRGKVSLVQVAAPSRETIPEYRDIRRRVESLVSRINERFGTPSWQPVRYIDRPLDHRQIAALFRASAVGLVTPLRDGMNLVAKEYIAAQDPENPGVLVLSGFAGAARELRDALIVDPRNPFAIAKGLRTAIGLPGAIRRSRHARMIAWLREYDVHRWQRDFLAALEETRTFAAPKTAIQEGERMPLPENRPGKISRRDVPAQSPWLPPRQDKLFADN